MAETPVLRDGKMRCLEGEWDRGSHLAGCLTGTRKNDATCVGTVSKQLLIGLGGVLMLLLDLTLDQLILCPDIWVVNVTVGVQASQVVQSFFVTIVVNKPAR